MRRLALATVVITIALVGGAGSVGAQSPSESPGAAPSQSAEPVASPAPSAPAGSVADTTCDPFVSQEGVGAAIGAPVAGVNSSDDSSDWKGTALHHVTCGWVTDAGPSALLEVRDDPYPVSGKKKPTGIDRWGIDGEALDDLGVKAFTGTTGGEAYVAWAAGLGDRDRTISITSSSVPVEALAALARLVDAAATPGEPVAAPPAEVGSVPEGLVGTWMVQTISGKTMSQLLEDTDAKTTDLTLTLTLGADGSAAFDFDCKPPKGKEPFAWKSTYTVDDTELDIEFADSTGSCKDDSLGDLLSLLSFSLGLATHPGAWTLDGDTLTITGNAGESLVLTRSAG